MKLKTKFLNILVNAGLLGGVTFLDYVTGYQFTLIPFYLLPILHAWWKIGQTFAFVIALVAAVAAQWVDIASGDHYTNYLTPIWNTFNQLALFLLVLVLVSNRDLLRKQVEERTKELREELVERGRLEKELLKITDAEQRRIGQDLHDSLGQHLTATALACKLIVKKLTNQTPVEPTAVSRMLGMLQEAIDMTRKLARTLHPIALGEEGLEDALRNLAADVAMVFNISCRFQSSGHVWLNDPGTALHLYRIAQEATSNAIRHGQARNLVIALEVTNKCLLLTVTDDGGGFAPGAPNKKGMGLRIMRYRAKQIGATFEIEELPVGGVRAVCVLNPADAPTIL